MLGKRSAIKVLLDGGKVGEAGYVEALKNSTLSSDIRALIETKLLPTQQSHIRSLDRVLEAQYLPRDSHVINFPFIRLLHYESGIF